MAVSSFVQDPWGKRREIVVASRQVQADAKLTNQNKIIIQ